jgi:transposase
MANKEEIPQTNSAEIENLIEQIRAANLEPGTKAKIERLLRTVLTLVELLQRRNTSIRKLREMIFGKRTERRRPKKPEPPAKSGEAENAADAPPHSAEDRAEGAERSENESESEKKPRGKGHGHRAASEYTGAKVVSCRNEELKPGDSCPDPCCGGRVYDLNAPTALIQFTGQPLITATKYEREVLRCAKCQERYEAPLPEGVAEERYDATCDATIALMKYGGGLPWHRQAGLQAMGGVPLAESTMWERCEATADAALGVWLEMTRLAANGELMHTDDTRVRILSCVKEDKQEKGRATQTSGIVAKADERRIALYLSGRNHAGENLAELLKRRSQELGRPIQMSDALAANTSVEKEVTVGYCLVHARRKIFEIKDHYPAECEVVLSAVAKVYQHEAEAKGLSAAGRLAWHQEKSGPVMEKLKEWIDAQLDQRQVESNSALGQALKYWRRHWVKLTLWLREPLMPLDNNPVELSLKQFILMRKNSLFFKTEHGAAVGDIMASLIQTCRLNGVNAWGYLVTLVRHKSEARRHPHRYLPWTYKGEAEEARAA